jgi:hypothetical protein
MRVGPQEGLLDSQVVPGGVHNAVGRDTATADPPAAPTL